MLSSRFKPYHIPLFLAKYAWLKARRRPVLVHFEVTLRCNARCGFCDYWKTDASAKADELKSFADAARFFDPMLVTFAGGEHRVEETRGVGEALELIGLGRRIGFPVVAESAARVAAQRDLEVHEHRAPACLEPRV